MVIPTKDVKMLIPSTAASLHRAFKKPKAVVLFRGPPAQHRWVSPRGRQRGGMGGTGEGREGRSEREMAGSVGGGGRTEVGEVRDAHRGIQINWEAGGKETKKSD